MRVSLLVLLASTLYATARYNIFKGVAWTDWPTYTFNKALALASLLLLVMAVLRKPRVGVPAASSVLPMASAFGLGHVLLSLALLSPAYYEKFFALGKLTAAAGLSMALGAMATVMMVDGASRGKVRRGHLGSLSSLAFVVGLHAALQGFEGWFRFSEWPGGLPPITLISFLLGRPPSWPVPVLDLEVGVASAARVALQRAETQ